MYFCKKEKFWDWLNTLIAIVVSVILAVAIGIGLFNHQTKITDEVKIQQFRKLLTAEISDIIDILDSGEFMTINLPSCKKTVLITYIQPLILESAASSGLFESLQTENMLHMARKIRMYNIKVSYLFSILAAGPSEPRYIEYEEQILHAIKNVEDTRKAIIDNSRFLSKQMDLFLQLPVKDNLIKNERK